MLRMTVVEASMTRGRETAAGQNDGDKELPGLSLLLVQKQFSGYVAQVEISGVPTQVHFHAQFRHHPLFSVLTVSLSISYCNGSFALNRSQVLTKDS